jgi:hypothetical protein
MTKTTKAKKQRTTATKVRTKSDQILSLLGRPSGASIAEMMKATGWQAHSVRGFLAGSLKRKGQTVTSEVDGNGVRRYRLVARVEA